MAKLESIPAELVSVEAEQNTISMLVDESIYPLEALYGASYVFIDRCYVLLDKPDAKHFRVTLALKREDGDLPAMMGEFANELLSCAWRHKITEANRTTIESVAMQAIAGAMGPPSLDDLAAFDFTEEPFEDPLGIALSWEEKYKKKDDAPAAAPAAEVKSA